MMASLPSRRDFTRYLTISDLSYRAFSLTWVHQCYIYGTKESVYLGKEFNSTGLSWLPFHCFGTQCNNGRNEATGNFVLTTQKFSFSWELKWPQEKLKIMLMQNFGVTSKEHYGMSWYFWSGQLQFILLN